MKPKHKIVIAITLCIVFVTVCAGLDRKNYCSLTLEEAEAKLDALLKNVKVNEVDNPQMDIYEEDITNMALADISAFPITVQGDGDINLEIAAATEISSEEPDDWLNVIADQFNKEEHKDKDGNRISITVRKITSGEAMRYIVSGYYKPDLYIPSNNAWGKMLKSSGIKTDKLLDRLLGNTAGFLIKRDVYNRFKEKYGEANVKTILEASNAGDLTFAYTNPYTSSTGLNILASMLQSFDEKNPVSDIAQRNLLTYQKTSPPVAYTTAVLRKQAERGIINAMVMEEQAYYNTPALQDYVYIPAGIRHDHPVYSFQYVSDDRKDAARMFLKYCMSPEQQQLASKKGFNLHNNYIGSPELSGADYLAAQKVWKQNRDGGKPILAVFITDVSGSMGGTPLNSLQSSLIAALPYINDDTYIGLISYNTAVTVNLPIQQFDEMHRACFAGEVKGLTACGQTATYNAVLAGLHMLSQKAKELPEAKLMLFLLTDGDSNVGYSLDQIAPIVSGMQVPVYTIAYNYSDIGELEKLSGIQEAVTIKAESEDIVNALRNLFNAVA